MVVPSPTPFGLGRNGCWPSRGSQISRALPLIFSLCCPLNDRSRVAHSFFKIGRMFFLFSCLSLARLGLLILLLLLMSGNVHPNPDSIFPYSVCAGNVTWWSKSVQCCTCSKWVHPRCSQLFLSKFRTLGSSHSWSCSSCYAPTRNTLTSSSDSSNLYTSTVQCGPPSANAAVPPHPRLRTSYPASAHFISSPSAHFISSPSTRSPPPLAPCCPSTPPAFSPPNFLRVLQWNARDLRARGIELLHFLSSYPVDIVCIQESNLTHLSLSGFLDSLLCVLIAPTLGLAFFPAMPRTLAAPSSFSSDRAYLSLNFLPSLFLGLIPTLIM